MKDTQRNTKAGRGGKALAVAALALALAVSAHAQDEDVPGVRFAGRPDTLYAPVRDLGQRLGWTVHWSAGNGTLFLKGQEVPPGERRALPDGTQTLPVRQLTQWGAAVRWNGDERTAYVEHEGKSVSVPAGRVTVGEGVTFADAPGTLYAPIRALGRALDKKVHWDAGTGTIYWDDKPVAGSALRSLPDGTRLLALDGLKRPLLISEEYGNARMPWSVQVRGDIVIHGFPTVPPRAASHGCVRVPLTGANPARWFYRWMEVGTPIEIRDGWPENDPAA